MAAWVSSRPSTRRNVGRRQEPDTLRCDQGVEVREPLSRFHDADVLGVDRPRCAPPHGFGEEGPWRRTDACACRTIEVIGVALVGGVLRYRGLGDGSGSPGLRRTEEHS